MKKNLLITFISITFLGNCIVLNKLGLNVDRIKGSEAASQIRSAAIAQDVLISAALAGRATVSILSLISDKLASIDEGATYYKPEVNKCISAIKGASGCGSYSNARFSLQSET